MSRALALLRNLAWLLFCLLLALFIWVLATFQRDPIVQRSYIQVPIELRLSDGYLFVEEPRRSATVFVRAQESMFERFTRDDISLFADLDNMGMGEHTVELRAEVRSGHTAAIADVSPRQITIQLEREIAREIAIEVEILGDTEPGYFLGVPQLVTKNVEVIGPANVIEQVVSARAVIAVHGRRNSFSEELSLVATNANGQRVLNVRLSPERVNVSVEVTTRDDIQQIAVHQPPLDFASLPWGYYPSSIHFDPQVIFVSGTPAQLAALPDFLTTERVDLSDRTEDFEVEVPIDIPAGLVVIDNQRMVTVSIGIAAQEGYRQYDAISVQVIGLPEGVEALVSPEQVAIFLAGPLPILKLLSAEQVQAHIDVSDLTLGVHSIPPQIALHFTELDVTSLSVVPALLDLELRTTSEE